jgi:hypothetical protein
MYRLLSFPSINLRLLPFSSTDSGCSSSSPRNGDAARDAAPSDQHTVLAHLRVDPSKEIPYDNTAAERIQHYKVVSSLLGIRMYVAMTLHIKPGKRGHTILWLIDTGSPFTFISRDVSQGHMNE